MNSTACASQGSRPTARQPRAGASVTSPTFKARSVMRFGRRRGWVWVVCGLMATCALSVASGAGSGVQGAVTTSPSCGGAQREGDDCHAPYVGVELHLLSLSGAVLASTRTSAAGAYRLDAPPGEYQLQVVTAVKFTRCPRPGVLVAGRAYTVVDIDCDSGMR